MTDIMQDVRDYFTDRFSSPLWLSIIVSWLLINWRLPITAIFESDRFNVSYINFYVDGTDHWCLITLPVLIGLVYSIFSSSAKETLEVLSKSIRSLIANIDRKGTLYRSISIAEHENQLEKLKRQLKKIETSKEQLNEALIENAKLTEENKNLTGQIASTRIEIEKQKTDQLTAQEEKLALLKNKDTLENSLSIAKTFIDQLTEEKNNLIIENEKLAESIREEKEARDVADKLNTQNSEKISDAINIKKEREQINSILKKHISLNADINPDLTGKLVTDLEKIGVLLSDKKDIETVIKNTYYETIIENSDEQLKTEISNPHSSVSIFLLFNAINAVEYYRLSDIQQDLGIPDTQLTKTFAIVMDAQWITQGPTRQYLLSDTGQEKFQELKSNPSMAKIQQIIFGINKETEKHIISILMENHLSLDTLKKEINFNYDIKSSLKNLLNERKISRSGKVFFYNKPQ